MLLKDTCNALCKYYVNNFIIDICEEKYDSLLLNEIIDNLKLYNIKSPNKKDIKSYINDYLKDNYVLRCDGNTYFEEKKTKSEISKIEKKKPEPVFKQGVAAQSEENIKQDMDMLGNTLLNEHGYAS